MSIKEALVLARAHMRLVHVSGEEDMRHQLAAIDNVAAVIKTLEEAEKEAATHEDGEDEEGTGD